MKRKTIDQYRLLMAEIYELAGLSRTISDREASKMGATAAQWNILSALTDLDGTVSEVADRLGLPRQAVHRVSRDMLATGLLARSDSGSLSCTDRGRQVREELFSASETRLAVVLTNAHVKSDELAQAAETVRRLIDSTRAWSELPPAEEANE